MVYVHTCRSCFRNVARACVVSHTAMETEVDDGATPSELEVNNSMAQPDLQLWRSRWRARGSSCGRGIK